MNKKWRLAYLVSHPIQYQAPLLRRIASSPDIELKAFFCSDFSVQGYADKEFGQAIKWDVPLLEGYDHEVLPGFGTSKSVGRLMPIVFGLKKRLKDGRFDALWVHGWNHWSHIWAILVARRLGIKVLLRGEANLHQPQPGYFKKNLKRMFLRWLFHKVDAFLSIGSWNREFYLDHGVNDESIFTVPYCVDNDFFRSEAETAARNQDEFRKSLGLQNSRPVILYASKLTSRKRATDLLDAYVELFRDTEDDRRPYLMIVGDGELKPELDARVDALGWDSIRLAGFANQSELPRYYSLADIFVLPSQNEPWGLVVNEAMNAGCAIIVTDEVGSGADLVEQGMNGYIIKAGDVAGLGEALKDSFQKEKFRAMGERSRQVIGVWGFNECVDGIRLALEKTCEQEK